MASLVAVATVWALSARRDWHGRDRAWLAVSAFVVAACAEQVMGVPAVAAGLIVVCAVVDARFEIIPNEVTAALWGVAMVSWLYAGAPLWPAVMAAGVGIMCLALFVFGAMGAGDVKLLPPAAMLALTSPATAAEALWGSCVLMGALCVFLLISHGAARAAGVRSVHVAMAPAICLATMSVAPFFALLSGSF